MICIICEIGENSQGQQQLLCKRMQLLLFLRMYQLMCVPYAAKLILMKKFRLLSAQLRRKPKGPKEEFIQYVA